MNSPLFGRKLLIKNLSQLLDGPWLHCYSSGSESECTKSWTSYFCIFTENSIHTIWKPACFLLVSLLNDLISFWVFPPRLNKAEQNRVTFVYLLRVQQDTCNLRIPNHLPRSFLMARYNWEVENQRYMKRWKAKVALQFCSTRASKSWIQKTRSM